jgi:hypothetical protein
MGQITYGFDPACWVIFDQKQDTSGPKTNKFGWTIWRKYVAQMYLPTKVQIDVDLHEVNTLRILGFHDSPASSPYPN